MKTYMKLFVPLLMTSMACAYVQNMLFPPPPTPFIPSATPTSSPTATFTPLPPTETFTPTPDFINPEPISCTDDDCLDDCLDRLDTVLLTEPLEPIDDKNYADKDEVFDLVIYQVHGNEISNPRVLSVPSAYRKYQVNTEAHQRIWDFYVSVIPPELRQTIKTFMIFTDGPRGTTAWVSRSGSSRDYSQVGFDLLDANQPVYLADTLIHETGHLVFLNNSQVPRDDDHLHYYDAKKKSFFECDQFVADGNCSLPDSYVNLFYQEFWKKIYPEWYAIDQRARDTDTPEEYWQVMDDFYHKHSDLFLDGYASTSVEEDMAESFAYFVLNPKPTGHEVYEQKINFYYEFPALVEYRRQIIEGLCTYIRK